MTANDYHFTVSSRRITITSLQALNAIKTIGLISAGIAVLLIAKGLLLLLTF